MNEDLFAFITNEDSKTTLSAEYASKRAIVMSAYADKIKPITADMSEAEIAGIKAAEKARDEALAKVEDWLTSELEAIFSNEEQKRKVYSDTDKIIQKGKEDLDTLQIQFTADEIKRNADKNKEIEKANAEHKDNLVNLENEKNKLLAESFKILKDIISSGYDEMYNQALEAYNAGKITAEQFDSIAKKLYDIRQLVEGNWNWSNMNNVPNFDFNLPKFAGGTEYLQKGNNPAGVDKIPIRADEGERIFSREDNKEIISNLGWISNGELVRRAIGISAANSRGLVKDITSSALARTGSAAVKSATPTLRQAQGGTVNNVVNNQYGSNTDNTKMEQLLEDIHNAIVEKPVMDWGTLGKYSDAERVNVERSRFR